MGEPAADVGGPSGMAAPGPRHVAAKARRAVRGWAPRSQQAESDLPDRLPPRAVRRRPEPTGTSLRSSLAVLGVIALLAAGAMIGGGAVALEQLRQARERVLSEIDPAIAEATALSTALLNQETGVRGYLIARQPDLLEPYLRGRHEEDVAYGGLTGLVGGHGNGLGDDLRRVRSAADGWRDGYAEPSVQAIRAGQPAPPLRAEVGNALFDQVRGGLTAFQSHLNGQAVAARQDLEAAGSTLQWVFALIAAGIVALLVVLALGLRRVVIRPISELAGEVRRVAGGDFDSEVRATGPREMAGLGADVEAMRRQIVAELAALRSATGRLDQQARDLARSNAELEQFAYVASHDLQEPLRKVASFSQLLQRRYAGRLDERADQYIAFAVDGAKRMQSLINDLLAFSRVGRLVHEHAEVPAGDLVGQAVANLSLAIEETGAQITVDVLPRVSGDVSLLTAVFQNLIGNAIKFHGDGPPLIHVGVRDAGAEWEFSVADNGIGIDPEYADRIFVLFQRLHPKEAYPGTGIGLALCRKIVEYHGGRIWLDADASPGTTFRFTLPKLDPVEDAGTDEPSATPGTATPGTATPGTATPGTATPTEEPESPG